MAETLGSLVDKLSIKNLRVWHIEEELESKTTAPPQMARLREKKELAEKQRGPTARRSGGSMEHANRRWEGPRHFCV